MEPLVFSRLGLAGSLVARYWCVSLLVVNLSLVQLVLGSLRPSLRAAASDVFLSCITTAGPPWFGVDVDVTKVTWVGIVRCEYW